MKKSIFYIIFLTSTIFLMSNCSKQESILPNTNANDIHSPFGKWKFASYADGKKIDSVITLELSAEKNQENLYPINGKSIVNFYFAYISVNETSKEIKISTLGSTKMAGSPQNMQFESAYFEKLSKVNKYELSNNQLILYLSDDKMFFDVQK